MHLIDRQQGAMAAKLPKVELRFGGHALVSGDVASEAMARVGRVVGRAQRERVTERRTSGGIGKRLLRRQTQAVARDHPTDALDGAGPDQAGRGNHRQQRLAAAWGDGCEDVACVGLAAGNRLDDAGDAFLVEAE